MYGVRLNGFETAFKKRFSFRYRYLAGLIGDGQHIAKALAFANCECFRLRPALRSSRSLSPIAKLPSTHR
jgi:hypothetical protein